MFGLGSDNNQSGGQAQASVAPPNTIPGPAGSSSVNGYVSPYLSPDQDLHLTSTPDLNIPQNQTEYINVSQEIANKIDAETYAALQNQNTTPPPATASSATDISAESITQGLPDIPVLSPDPLQVAEPKQEGTQIKELSEEISSPIKEVDSLKSESLVVPESTTLPLNPGPKVDESLNAEKVENTLPKNTLESLTTTQSSSTVENTTQEVQNKEIETPAQSDSLELNGSLPTVESLSTPAPVEYLENPMFDKTLDPEHDLGIDKEVISSLLDGSKTEEKPKQIQELGINDLLDIVVQRNGSDLHLTVGYKAMIRVDGELIEIGEELTEEYVKKLVSQTLNTNQKELLEINREVDLSYSHPKARFRVNAYFERGHLAAAYRLIPTKIKSIEELSLPNVLYDFTRLAQGLFLVTGPTGHGKSTTLAAMIQEINQTSAVHIITVEDPIEYMYPKAKALVDQREMGQDTHDWNIALRSILRQDPDIVLIGEMRDFETIQSALTIAETGHLVFATLHTNSAAESIDRIIDVFPPHQQPQVRVQLASSLKGVLSQRLIPKIGGGRDAASELLIVTPAVQNLIRESKTYQIDNVISTSYDLGMCTLERSLVKMIREGKISVETAQEYAIRPKEILKLMRSNS